MSCQHTAVQQVTEYPWIAVSGFGAHIKTTATTLIIRKKNTVEEYPLGEVKSLLIVGGHTINSAAITSLIRRGACISFFEPDGTPAGTLCPPVPAGEPGADIKKVPRHRFAVALAQASAKARLFFMEQEESQKNARLFYEGELDFLRKSEEELAFLIKLDEIRRLHRLVSDMYYEIMSRNLPPDLGFRRRGKRPHTDPVNAMLSLGYAMLFGNCTVAAFGARLDPDNGFLHDGKDSLVHDLIDPLKPAMVDTVVFALAREGLKEGDYELTPGRCILSEDLVRQMTARLRGSIQVPTVNRQVLGLAEAVRNGGAFTALY